MTRRPRPALLVLMICVIAFMLVLDLTVVVVALPDMQADLDASLSELQWVFDAYALPMAALLLSAATFGDRIGRYPLMFGGLVVFTAASAACALAQGAGSLSVFRGVQGVGAAVLYGIAVPLIADAVGPGRRRGLAIGAFGAASGAAIAVGPLLGGALTQLLDWRAIFWINVPIGVVILVALPLLSVAQVRSRQPIDWLGTLGITVALVCLIAGLLGGNERGWAAPATLGLLGAAALAFGGFLVVQVRAESPMVDLRLFRDRVYSASVLLGFTVQATLVAALAYLSLYAQNVLLLDSLATGLRFLPFSLTACLAAAAIAPFVRAVPAKWLLGGTGLLLTTGLALLATLGAGSSWTDLLPGMIIGGLAIGCAATVVNQLSVEDVDPAKAGMAAGVSTSFRQIGLAVGVAALGAVFHASITGALPGRLRALGLPPEQTDTLTAQVAAGSGVVPGQSLTPALASSFADVATTATTSAVVLIMTIGAVLAAATTVACLLLARPPAVDRSAPPELSGPDSVAPGPGAVDQAEICVNPCVQREEAGR